MKYYCSSQNLQHLVTAEFPLNAAITFYNKHKHHIKDVIVVSEVGFPGGSHSQHSNDTTYSKKYVKEQADSQPD